MKGKVVRIVRDKLFGFISYGDKDYFFHKKDYKSSWDKLLDDYENHHQIFVTFDDATHTTTKGNRAANVTRTTED